MLQSIFVAEEPDVRAIEGTSVLDTGTCPQRSPKRGAPDRDVRYRYYDDSTRCKQLQMICKIRSGA